MIALSCACGRFGFGVLPDSQEQDGSIDADTKDADLIDADVDGSDADDPDRGDTDFDDETPADTDPDGTDADIPDARDSDVEDADTEDSDIDDPTACDDIFSGVLFCDGFEDEALAAWIERPGDGTVERTTTTVYRGSGALRAQTFARRDDAAVYTMALSELASGDMYVRAYFYIPSGQPVDGATPMFIGEEFSPWDGVAFDLLTDGSVFLFHTDSDSLIPSKRSVPLDRWFCCQIHVELDDIDGRAELRIDDELYAELNGVDTIPTDGYTNLVVGIDYTNNDQPGILLYVDEVAADTAPVACD